MKHSNPPALHAPTGYSHVVEVVARRTLYVSGQIALDADGRLVGPDDLNLQAIQVFETCAPRWRPATPACAMW